MTRSPLVIIGGGPAGMAAAIEAARAGLSCALIDEAPGFGGQIYRQIPEAFSVRDASALGKDYRRGEALRAELREHSERVTILPHTTVLGLSPDREIVWAREETAGVIRADQLILATGAHERSVPFPGWTLPGVMTAGGAQRLIKTMQVRPGRRAVVAGTGPLPLVVANQLRTVGTEVVAVLEAGRHPWWPRFLVRAWGEWSILKDAFDYWLGLRRAGIPLRFNHTVFQARGNSSVEAVTYGPIDPATWSPIRERAQQVEVDLVVVGFGLVPNVELTQLAGCDHRYVHEVGGWVPVRTPQMETTVSGVFAAGDGAGVRGALVAIAEGRIAGITAAERAGLLSQAEAHRRRAPFIARLKALLRVRAVLDEMSRLRPGLDELATPETIICRCEEVALAEVEAAIEQGARDLQAVKLFTRLGMGSCQGGNCAPAIGPYICRATGRTPEQVGRINPRLPVKPVTLGALAGMAEIGDGAGDPRGAISGELVP